MKSIFLFLSLLFIGIISFSQETGGPYIPDENTVLLMHFDGNATNSANVGSDGIEHGSGISYEDGVHGQCLRLDNSTPDKQSWIEVPFYDELNFTEEFSIECWFKINSWGNDHTYIPTLFKKGENWPADYDSGLGSSENTFWANLNCVNDEYSRNIKVDTYPGVISDGSWYHISLTFKPQTEPEYWMYMDLLIRDENYKEVFATTGFAPTPPFNSNEKLLIGFGKSDNSYFDGWIDEFRISKKARKYRDDIISTINTEDFKDSVPPMLRDRWTTYYPPITKYFPIDTITGERYKGNSCGMTIMIRLLHFWEHPRFPSGNIDYWFGSVHWQADFDNTEYLFDLMPDKFGPNPTEEEYAASAIFAQQVSAATRIYYDNMNSMPQLLTDYFHYKEGMKLYFRHQFTKEEWIKIFKNELSQGRPIMAAGLEEIFDEGGAAGHYYIVDGYSLEGKFHSDESFGEVDFWVDIDSFPYGNFQTIMIGAEPDWHGKTLTLDYPKGNEYFQKQTEIEISWESGNISTVLLEYSTDAGKNWQTLAENVDAATGSYLWTIPDISSEEYKVRISDTEDGNVYRRCETFNVFDRQIVEFEYPGAGNVIQSGIEQPLYWQSEGIQAFKLEYSTDMTSWNLLIDSVNAETGQAGFTIPETITGQVVLRAVDLNNETVSFNSEPVEVVAEKPGGGANAVDENTVLLMHFENDLSNAADNGIVPYENSSYGSYIENYERNLGKAFRVDNSEGSDSHCIIVENSDEFALGNNWTIETWVNIASYGSDNTEYPFILDKRGAFGFGLDHNGNGFSGYAVFSDNSEAHFFQGQPLETNSWYHISMASNATEGKVFFKVHDDEWNLMYSDEQDLPAGTNGELKTSENDLFIGGVEGGSNIQFDGWYDELHITKSVEVPDYDLPVVESFDATNISSTSATLNGDVSSDGGTTITQRGFYWSATNTSPNASDDVETVPGTTGEFSFDLAGLNHETIYHYRAFATNSEGTAVGDVKAFTTAEEGIVFLDLPFEDDFEEEISVDATFTNWTTENIEGWNYWHIIPGGGADGGQCMRFEKTGINQEDWLITLPIDCSEAEQLQISFNELHNGYGTKPVLLYTTSYNGDASQSVWTEIDYALGSGMDQWNSIDDLVVESPGELVYFAFKYESVSSSELYIVLDNFRVEAYDPIPEFQLAGSSAHFNYYTNMPESLNFYLDIQDGLEAEFVKLNSHWNRPGQDKVFEDDAKINVYFSYKENVEGLQGYVDIRICGFYMADGSAIFLTPLLTDEQVAYYNDLAGEAVHTFAKMALRRRMARDVGGVTPLPGYFGEGFGLYENGYRPNRDSIIAFLDAHPGELDHEDISTISDIFYSAKKDIVVSYVEGQILLPLGHRGCWPDYSSYPPIWNNYLHYFYTTNDTERIEFKGQSENFDVYCSSRDVEYVDSMLVWLERTLDFYKTNYEMEINNRFNMVVLYDEQTGMDLTGYDEFNGGAGSLNISPDNNPEGIEGYPWLLAHEFGHVFNDYMYYDFPFGFYHEGMANFSGYKQYGVDWMESKWQIDYVFSYYQKIYSRYPTLDEFENDPDLMIDPYFFGLQFIRYLESFSTLIEIRDFFNAGLDFSVFGKTRDEIHQGYINYLLALNGSGVNVIENQPYALSVNPYNDKIEIEQLNGSERIISVMLFDVKGRKIYSKKITGKSAFEIELSGYPANNIFLLKIYTTKKVYVEKIFL